MVPDSEVWRQQGTNSPQNRRCKENKGGAHEIAG